MSRCLVAFYVWKWSIKNSFNSHNFFSHELEDWNRKLSIWMFLIENIQFVKYSYSYFVWTKYIDLVVFSFRLPFSWKNHINVNECKFALTANQNRTWNYVYTIYINRQYLTIENDKWSTRKVRCYIA